MSQINATQAFISTCQAETLVASFDRQVQGMLIQKQTASRPGALRHCGETLNLCEGGV